MACGSCGQRHVNPGRRQNPPSDDLEGGLTIATPIAGSAHYLVIRNRDAASGKRFSSLEKAQDYARRTGGVIRHV